MYEQLAPILGGLAGLIVVTLLVIFLVRKRRRAAEGLRSLGFDSVKMVPLRAKGSIAGMDVRLEHVNLTTDEDRDGDSFLLPVTRLWFAGRFAGRAIVRLPHWNAAERVSTTGLERVETGDGAFDRTWHLYTGDERASAVWSQAATRDRLKQLNIVLDLDISPAEVVITLSGQDPSREAVEKAIRLAETLQDP